MSSNAASTNGATQTAIEAVVPDHIAFRILGRVVKALAVAIAEKRYESGRVRPAGINFRAKKRLPLPASKATAQDLLKGLVGKVLHNDEPVRLGEKYLDDSGAVIVGKEADKLDKTGKVKSVGRPQIVFVAHDVIGGISYQILVKCRIGETREGRYLEIAIDSTRSGTFTEMGDFEGDWDDLEAELLG